jgi:hypothetical protein
MEFGFPRRFVIICSAEFRSFSVYPTSTLATLGSRVTAVHPAGLVAPWIGVSDAKAFGRVCVGPPGDVG